MIPATLGGGILSPSINSLITKRVAAAETGATLGVSSSLASIATSITPLVGGALFQALGSTLPFLLGGLFMGLLAVAALRHLRPGPEEQIAPAPAGG